MGKVSLPISGQPTSTHNATADGQAVSGTTGNDQLVGFGKPGSGSGTLVGKGGDDTYVVWSNKHRIIENAGEGIDTVQSHWTYTLQENVENLILIGKGPNSAFGNALDNIIVGNANKNVIDGGTGDDQLTGGGGNDVFFVSGRDTITDFSAGDHVNLQSFTAFTSFAKVKAAMTQAGRDTLLKLNANESVLFQNMSVGQFTADMFVVGNPVDNYDLVFADEFDTFTLNLGTGSTDNWHPLYPRSGLAGHTVIGRSVQYFTYPEDEGTYGAPVGINPFSLKNGVLTITMDRVAPEDRHKVYGYEYTSGNITSIGSFHQTYGYFEIRAKLAAGSGLHDAFWMLPMDGGWPPELDIVEQRGSDPTRVINGVHSGESTTSGTFVVPTAATEFHTYGLDWEPDFLTYYIDGVAVRTVPTPAGLDVPMYLLANLGGGSEWAGKPNSSTPFPAKLQIDYIRAYASENTLERNGPFNKAGTNADETMHGTTGDDTLNGGGGDDKLYGGAGNDTLIGGGGKDLLDGGFGDDTYIITSGQERISEGGVKGTDTVKTSLAAYTLGLNVENLIYTGSGATAFRGSGNSENNVITGSAAGGTLNGGAGNDTLNGGAGIDALNGGDGDDIAYGRDGRDTLRGNGGNDQLFGGDGDDKIGGDDGDDIIDGGAGNDNIGGNAGNDTLIGGNGADRLDGGVGADTMIGGSGDDAYFVDDARDTITEAAGGGDDTVRVFVDRYTLSANVEAMSYGGSSAFTGSGNESANRISGGDGNDVLDGRGGADTLTGGKGNDRFVFSRGQADGDRVTDFSGAGVAGGDKLVFTGFGKGVVTRIGATDSYLIRADAAHGGGTETITLSGVAGLAAGDYEFDGAPSTNAPPSDITASNLSVAENVATGTTIGILSAIDPDAGDTATFRLLDDAGGLFRLSGNQLIVGGALSYGTSATHVITVQATDSAGETYAKSLTVKVTKVTVDEALRGTEGADSFTYNSALPYKRYDGLAGADTVTVAGRAVVVSANGTDVGLDIGANGSVDFTTANVEHLVLFGSEIALVGSLAATALKFGGVSIIGTGAEDTLDGSLAGVALTIDGGDGSDIVRGGTEADQLRGGAGNDRLYAGGGADTLRGGAGNDTYYLDHAGQTIIENAGEGTDRVVIQQDYTLGDNVEGLSLSGTFGHTATGNGLDNFLVGSLGDDVLDGKAGADRLTGDQGADTFVFTAGEAEGDSVSDFAGGESGDVLVFHGYGNGTITRIGTSDSYQIKADAAHGGVVETIRLEGVTNLSWGDYRFLGAGTGNAAPSQIVLSNLAIAENAAVDTVVGVLSAVDPDENDAATFRLTDDAGGRFAIVGKKLVIAGALDFESQASHAIRVQATDTAGNTVTRWLTVSVTDAQEDTRHGSWGDDSFTYSPSLTYNRLDGRGGMDTLAMAASTLSVSARDGDVALDIGANGSVDLSTVAVERLVLSGSHVALVGDMTTTHLADGEIAITGTGEGDRLNASRAGVRVVIDGGEGKDIIRGSHLADTLMGGAGSDKLYAGGGRDTLVGGAGNDTYYLDDPTQTVVEQAGGGVDRVVVKSDYTLSAAVEDLTLAGSLGHAGTGNGLRNKIVGSAGDDVLDGRGGADRLLGGAGDDVLIGGAGADTLTGAAGADVFRFTVLESSAAADKITGFARGQDRIELAQPEFAALSLGALDPTQFHSGAEAITADHHLIYDRAVGALYYDEDGVGGQEQVLVATLMSRPLLGPSDLFVI